MKINFSAILGGFSAGIRRIISRDRLREVFEKNVLHSTYLKGLLHKNQWSIYGYFLNNFCRNKKKKLEGNSLENLWKISEKTSAVIFENKSRRTGKLFVFIIFFLRFF